jgi:hypothetical protein
MTSGGNLAFALPFATGPPKTWAVACFVGRPVRSSGCSTTMPAASPIQPGGSLTEDQRFPSKVQLLPPEGSTFDITKTTLIKLCRYKALTACSVVSWYSEEHGLKCAATCNTRGAAIQWFSPPGFGEFVFLAWLAKSRRICGRESLW